jgi:tetrahydromethanopterin S-methyltransferase subunit G
MVYPLFKGDTMYINKALYDALRSGDADEDLAEKAAESTASIDRLEERITGVANMVSQLKWIGGVLFGVLLGLILFMARLS